MWNVCIYLVRHVPMRCGTGAWKRGTGCEAACDIPSGPPYQFWGLYLGWAADVGLELRLFGVAWLLPSLVRSLTTGDTRHSAMASSGEKAYPQAIHTGCFAFYTRFFPWAQR